MFSDPGTILPGIPQFRKGNGYLGRRCGSVGRMREATGVDSPVPCKWLIVAHAYIPSTWEIETEGPEVQDWLLLPSEFKASLGYRRSDLKEKSSMFIRNVINGLCFL